MYVPHGPADVEERARQGVGTFSAMVVMLYPNLPGRCLENLTVFAFSKGGVGWQEVLPLRERVVRAVAAHARHCHTRYDRLMRMHAVGQRMRPGPALQEQRRRQEAWARRLVEPEVTRLLETWASHGRRF